MPATKYELRNGTGTRFMFPEVDVEDIRNNVIGNNSGSGGSTTTATRPLPGSEGITGSYISCAPCNPDAALSECQAAGNELLDEYNNLVDEFNNLSQKTKCLEELTEPVDYGGTAAWSIAYVSTRPDYGPPYSSSYPPPCTKTVSSVFKVEYVSGIKVRFTRNNVNNPSNCKASGTVSIGFNTQANGNGGNLSILWNSGPGESFSTVNVTLGSTWYVFVAGLNLNENGPPTAYTPLGSFTIDATGNITRTVTTVSTTTEGSLLPCTKDEGPFSARTMVNGVNTYYELTEGPFTISSSNSQQTVSSVFAETGTQTYPTFGGTWSMSDVTVTSSEQWAYISSTSITFIPNP